MSFARLPIRLVGFLGLLTALSLPLIVAAVTVGPPFNSGCTPFGAVINAFSNPAFLNGYGDDGGPVSSATFFGPSGLLAAMGRT